MITITFVLDAAKDALGHGRLPRAAEALLASISFIIASI